MSLICLVDKRSCLPVSAVWYCHQSLSAVGSQAFALALFYAQLTTSLTSQALQTSPEV